MAKREITCDYQRARERNGEKKNSCTNHVLETKRQKLANSIRAGAPGRSEISRDRSFPAGKLFLFQRKKKKKDEGERELLTTERQRTPWHDAGLRGERETERERERERERETERERTEGNK